MIKLAISGLLFFVINFAFSQTLPSKDLRKVIKDSSNHFRHFKSAFKGMLSDDSAFLSSIAIEGTRKNEVIVVYHSDSSLIKSSYFTIVADSLKQKEGKKIIDEWKGIISLLFGGGIETTRHLIKPTAKALYGWTLNRGQFWVDIYLYKSDSKPDAFVVYLNLTYYGLTWRRSKEGHYSYKFR